MRTKVVILMILASFVGFFWGIIKSHNSKEIPLSELARIANEKKRRR